MKNQSHEHGYRPGDKSLGRDVRAREYAEPQKAKQRFFSEEIRYGLEQHHAYREEQEAVRHGADGYDSDDEQASYNV